MEKGKIGDLICKMRKQEGPEALVKGKMAKQFFAHWLLTTKSS